MINPAQLSLLKTDGTKRNIIIEPILEKDGENNLRSTSVFKISKDAFGEESALFTEPLEINEINDDLSDDNNPDYLGKIIINSKTGWVYEGELLDSHEQKQAAEYILNHK